MICLRILGFARAVSLTMFARLSAVAWAGLALNVVTGLALFSGDPVKFFYHPVFWIKISLITLGAASLWMLVRALRETVSAPGGGSGMPTGAKLVAGCSLAFWAGVIVAGRLIAFSDPFRYYPNIAFRIKMLFIILAGLNALYFVLTVHRQAGPAGGQDPGAAIRTVSALSFLFWVGVIILGRFIPYVE